jgi:SP family general alpha glucoside:H+ symporter-like MFS transporter
MATDIKDTGIPVEVQKLSTQVSHGEEIAEAIAIEHTLSFWEALKLYPKAIGWSMYFSMGVIMLGILPSNSHIPSRRS